MAYQRNEELKFDLNQKNRCGIKKRKEKNNNHHIFEIIIDKVFKKKK